MKLNLYDKDLRRISIIGEQFISCLWAEGYNTVENFTLELNATDEYKKKIRPDCYVGRDDRKTLMVIKSVQASDEKIVATGKQATRVLGDVAFIGSIGSGSAIDISLRNAYNNSNKYRGVEFADTNLGVKYEHQIGNKSFLELCEKMCQDSDVGFRSVRSDSGMVVELYVPEEKQNLVFSEKFGNVNIGEIGISEEPLKNYAIVLGSGEGEERVRVDVDETNGEDRRELIVDARDLQKEEEETSDSYLLRLTARGHENLLDRRSILSCAFSPISGDFGKKYDLGDVLTIHMADYGMTVKARVVRFTQKMQKNTMETKIEVGHIIYKR